MLNMSDTFFHVIYSIHTNAASDQPLLGSSPVPGAKNSPSSFSDIALKNKKGGNTDKEGDNGKLFKSFKGKQGSY